MSKFCCRGFFYDYTLSLHPFPPLLPSSSLSPPTMIQQNSQPPFSQSIFHPHPSHKSLSPISPSPLSHSSTPPSLPSLPSLPHFLHTILSSSSPPSHTKCQILRRCHRPKISIQSLYLEQDGTEQDGRVQRGALLVIGLEFEVGFLGGKGSGGKGRGKCVLKQPSLPFPLLSSYTQRFLVSNYPHPSFIHLFIPTAVSPNRTEPN